MTLLDFESDLLVDKDRTRAKRRYDTVIRHRRRGGPQRKPSFKSKMIEADFDVAGDREHAFEAILDRELHKPADPAEWDPYYACLFPVTQEEIDELDRIFQDDMAAYYVAEQLRDLYVRTGWGPGPMDHIAPVDGYDNYYNQYGEFDLARW